MCILNLRNKSFRANFDLHIDYEVSCILVARSKANISMYFQVRRFTYQWKVVLFLMMKLSMLLHSNIVNNNRDGIDTLQADNIVLNRCTAIRHIDHTEQRTMLNKESKQDVRHAFINN